MQSALAAVLAAMSANRVPAARAALAKLYELASDCVQVGRGRGVCGARGAYAC